MVKYNKDLINKAFNLKEKLEGKDKEVVAELIVYVNEVYADVREIKDNTRTISKLYDLNDKLNYKNKRLTKQINEMRNERNLQ